MKNAIVAHQFPAVSRMSPRGGRQSNSSSSGQCTAHSYTWSIYSSLGLCSGHRGDLISIYQTHRRGKPTRPWELGLTMDPPVADILM